MEDYKNKIVTYNDLIKWGVCIPDEDFETLTSKCLTQDAINADTALTISASGNKLSTIKNTVFDVNSITTSKIECSYRLNTTDVQCFKIYLCYCICNNDQNYEDDMIVKIVDWNDTNWNFNLYNHLTNKGYTDEQIEDIVNDNGSYFYIYIDYSGNSEKIFTAEITYAGPYGDSSEKFSAKGGIVHSFPSSAPHFSNICQSCKINLYYEE